MGQAEQSPMSQPTSLLPHAPRATLPSRPRARVSAGASPSPPLGSSAAARLPHQHLATVLVSSTAGPPTPSRPLPAPRQRAAVRPRCDRRRQGSVIDIYPDKVRDHYPHPTSAGAASLNAAVVGQNPNAPGSFVACRHCPLATGYDRGAWRTLACDWSRLPHMDDDVASLLSTWLNEQIREHRGRTFGPSCTSSVILSVM